MYFDLWSRVARFSVWVRWTGVCVEQQQRFVMWVASSSFIWGTAGLPKARRDDELTKAVSSWFRHGSFFSVNNTLLVGFLYFARQRTTTFSFSFWLADGSADDVQIIMRPKPRPKKMSLFLFFTWSTKTSLLKPHSLGWPNFTLLLYLTHRPDGCWNGEKWNGRYQTWVEW